MDIDDFGNLCMGCMTDKGDNDICPQCGYQMERRRNPAALPYQAILNNKFLIGRILGKPGGFGITYLAWDLVLHTTVAIKEYLPRDLATRDANRMTVVPYNQDEESIQEFGYGLRQFLNEARTLCKFSHPNVVRVREFFEQNKTAYLVMDYYEGISLEEYLKRNGGMLGETTALTLMQPILEGLREVHAKGFLHRDIKPSNIYLTKAGIPILLDFGAARLSLHGQRSRPLSVIFTPGFAPFEQYLEKKEFGPTVDIYAVAATLYYLVTGTKPSPATERVQKDTLLAPVELVANLTQKTSSAIMSGLAIKEEERPQSIDALWALLRADEPVIINESSRLNSATAPSKPQTSNLQVSCPHCQARNPVPRNTDLSRLFCARCGKSLRKSKNRWLLPMWLWGILGLSVLSVGFVISWRHGKPVVSDVAVERGGQALPLSESIHDEGGDTPQPSIKTSADIADAPAGDSTNGELERRLPRPRQSVQRMEGFHPPYPPPQNAIDVCQKKQKGSDCEMPNPEGRHEVGVCQQVHDYFACVPKGLPPLPLRQ